MLIEVIDDDAAVRESLELLLASHGYAVRTHDSAEAFLARTPQGARRTLAVVDLDLPGIDGLELLRRLADQVPAIVVTGRVQAGSAALASEAGARVCLLKPFAPADLLAAIATLAA